MLWPSIIGSTVLTSPKSTSQIDLDSPYVFSIHIEEEGNRTQSLVGIPYDFLIEDIETKHYLQLVFRSGKLCSVDGLAIRKERCIAYNSPYSELGTEISQMLLFAVVPLTRGDVPRLMNSTIAQKTKISIRLYIDTVVISFDDFNIAGQLRMADGFDVAITENGSLAALIFRNHLADYISTVITRKK
jgi:hypothetical protein